MRPIRFEAANQVFTRPPGWKEEDCSDIHAFRGKDASDRNVIITCWKPTDAERVQIAAGEPVFLTLLTDGLPPHYIGTKDPFEEPLEPTEG